MSPLIHRIANTASLGRSVAVAALLGATFLTGSLTAARADSVANAAIVLAQAAAAPGTPAGPDVASDKAETVDQRITNLHAALKITPDEETKWTGVADAMRENAAAMAKLSSEKAAVTPQSMTAMDDLKAYQTFAQAHVDGLKNLISSFGTLYSSMPDAQKKVTDAVFENFGRSASKPAHG
jgi:protein CpxP